VSSPVLDTSAAARGVQLAVNRQMSGEQRVELAMAISEEARQISRDGIATRHPDWSARQIHIELIRLRYGDRIAAEADSRVPLDE
jgi:hypothetical protein